MSEAFIKQREAECENRPRELVITTIRTKTMIKIIKRSERKKKTAVPTRTQSGTELVSYSAVEFRNTVKVWIEQFRHRRHLEAQRTFRSLFRES